MQMFIRAVEIVRISFPSEQQRIDIQNLSETHHGRDSAPFPDQYRGFPECRVVLQNVDQLRDRYVCEGDELLLMDSHNRRELHICVVQQDQP